MNENMAKMALQEVEILVMGRHYISARQKLVQMKNLYAYDWIDSMLTLCEVLSANSSHPGCGVDHYWILNASPLNTLRSITTSYNRILNSLNQLNIEFPASQLALKLVKKAFPAISDKRKRISFDYGTHSGSERRFQDYFDFECDRCSDCIEEGQTWAVDFVTSLTHGYKYGRVSFVSEEALRVTRLRPVPVSSCERSLCESGFPVSCGKFEFGPDTESDMSWPAVPSYRCELVHGNLDNQYEIYPRRGEVWAVYKDWDIEEWASCGLDKLEQCRYELVEIKSEFSKYTGVDCAYLEKVDGFRCVFQRKTFQVLHIRPGMFYMFSHKVPCYRFGGGEFAGIVGGMFELDWAGMPDHIMSDTTEAAEKTECLSKEFKPCWSVEDFRAGQIWTVRSEGDQMPRKYARIDRIVSESQVCATFLKPLVERENLPIVSGLFTVGSTSINKDVSQLSFKVRCQRREDPFYEIHPMKGEVWAMYKKQGNEWKPFDCEVVLILSDTSEEEGTKIAMLEEVNGYLTFFQKQQWAGFDRTGIVTESLGFSHRIASFRVPGIERHGIHEGVWHLEPTALPRNNQGFRFKC